MARLALRPRLLRVKKPVGLDFMAGAGVGRHRAPWELAGGGRAGQPRHLREWDRGREGGRGYGGAWVEEGRRGDGAIIGAGGGAGVAFGA